MADLGIDTSREPVWVLLPLSVLSGFIPPVVVTSGSVRLQEHKHPGWIFQIVFPHSAGSRR